MTPKYFLKISHVKWLFFINGLILILTSCQKSREPEFVYEDYDELIKYSINFNGNIISNYTKYINNEISETTQFFDYDSIVERITKGLDNETKYKMTFFLRDDGFAHSSLDSSFSETGMYISKSVYSYKNGFLVNRTYNYWRYHEDNIDSGHVVITNVIEGENISSHTIQSVSWITDTKHLIYNNHLNLIDVKDLLNEIRGRRTKNLVEHSTLNEGHNLSYSLAYDHYQYEFDNDGLITREFRIRTPYYNTLTEEQVTRTVYTTTYEYNFN